MTENPKHRLGCFEYYFYLLIIFVRKFFLKYLFIVNYIAVFYSYKVSNLNILFPIDPFDTMVRSLGQ